MSPSFSSERLPDLDISFAKKLTTVCNSSTHVLGCHTDVSCATTKTPVGFLCRDVQRGQLQAKHHKDTLMATELPSPMKGAHLGLVWSDDDALLAKVQHTFAHLPQIQAALHHCQNGIVALVQYSIGKGW